MQEFGVKNNSDSEVIPPFSVVRPVGYEIGTECVIVAVPDTDNETGLFVTGEGAILPSGYGKARINFFEKVSYNTIDGTPAAGDDWGVKANSYSLRKTYQGFTVVGGAFQAIANFVRVGGGGVTGDTLGLWVEITGGSDAAGYSGKRKVRTSGTTWADAATPSPLTWTNAIYRAPSVLTTSIPVIPVGQVVRCWPSPVDTTKLEIMGVGGRQTVSVEVVTNVACVSGSIVVTKSTLNITGRDVTLSVT